jgi:hypothetical protein
MTSQIPIITFTTVTKNKSMENTLTIIGLGIVIAGWWITNTLAKRKDYQLELKKWKKEHLDSQLSTFYGQIYGILLENDRIRVQLTKQIGRKIIFRANKPLTDDERKLWLFYVENYFIPNNRKIVNLIKNNSHLLNGFSFPKTFLSFIDYSVGWELLHEQYKKLNIDYPLHYPENFPREFKTEIVGMVSKLKKQQWELVSLKTIEKKTKRLTSKH